MGRFQKRRPIIDSQTTAHEPMNVRQLVYKSQTSGGLTPCLRAIATLSWRDPGSEMTETAPSPATPPAETSAKKKQPKKPAAAKNRPVKSGPSVSELIVKAVSASKERSGVSLAALKKALAAGGYDVEKNNSRLKLALKGLVSKETLIQLKGSGASGSFKLNKKQLESKEKTSKKKEIPVKPKKAAPKKREGGAWVLEHLWCVLSNLILHTEGSFQNHHILRKRENRR
ncbi:histone H1A-like [Spea bombifrons]|uniref:histone H1A-like n=1 Tax=Spea bombifrons TaxID=233779 RepID=UPI00234B1C69|nr:histone H1A-like [Spea bombifrons]